MRGRYSFFSPVGGNAKHPTGLKVRTAAAEKSAKEAAELSAKKIANLKKVGCAALIILGGAALCYAGYYGYKKIKAYRKDSICRLNPPACPDYKDAEKED